MKHHILVLGAPGSGTTTLGKALSKKLGYGHLDTDDFYWEESDPPFTKIRSLNECQSLMKKALEIHNSWIISGSLVGWGDVFIAEIDLVIFLWLPETLRLQRIYQREKTQNGSRIEIGGDMHDKYVKFIEWTSQYDAGNINIKSKALHEWWIASFSCQVLRLEGSYDLRESIDLALSAIE